MTLWESIRTVGPILGWAFALSARAQTDPGIQQEGDSAVFRTGAGLPLLTTNAVFQIPEGGREPRLEFEFGFATSETVVPETFFDSFSITLQSQDEAATALLTTVDATAVVWAPSNPGGLTLDDGAIERTTVPFPDLLPEHALRYSFAVSLAIPSPFFGLTAWLFLDLFDNQDSSSSLAYARNVRIAALPSTNFPVGLRLWSSAAVSGPFAEEAGWSLDLTNRVITLPEGGAMRFYRTRGGIRTRVTALERTREDVVLRYAFDPEMLLLESALDPAGPYAAVANVTVDILNQVLRIPLPKVPSYYRIRSDGAALIVELRPEGDQLALFFEFPGHRIELWSSAAPAGPFAQESGVAVDPTARTIRIPRGGAMRFFRVQADRAIEITQLEKRAGQWLLSYR